MPGFNGTGPTGAGSGTGRGLGWCRPNARYSGRNSQGLGRGFQRGRGYRQMNGLTGMTKRMRFGQAVTRSTVPSGTYNREQEIDDLRAEAAALREELNNVEATLRRMEPESDPEA